MTSPIIRTGPGSCQVLARLLLAQGDAAAAGALLDRLDTAAASRRRIGSVIEIRAIRAMALAALGDEAGAMAAGLTLSLGFRDSPGLRRRGRP